MRKALTETDGTGVLATGLLVSVTGVMTTPSNGHGEPMTVEEFQDRLAQLLRTAAANGVDVRGGWPCQPARDGERAWDVEIVEVAHRR